MDADVLVTQENKALDAMILNKSYEGCYICSSISTPFLAAILQQHDTLV